MQDSKDKAEQLRQELRQADHLFRTEKKNLKVNYQARKALIKGDLTKVEKTLKTKKGGLKSRVVWHMDSLTLRICRPFEEKATEIRYKRSDPEGYEADQVYLASGPILRHLQKKAEKGKELSKRELDLVAKLMIAFTAVRMRRLGHYFDKAEEILHDLNSLLPMPIMAGEAPEAEVMNLMNQFSEMLQGATKAASVTSESELAPA